MGKRSRTENYREKLGRDTGMEGSTGEDGIREGIWGGRANTKDP